MLWPVQRARCQETRDLLLLVMEAPPSVEEIALWTKAARAAVERWAAREHLVASDNRLSRLKRPAVLG